jgi:hypothetical protein
MSTVNCRPVPLWRRVPAAIFSAVLLIVALFVVFIGCLIFGAFE